MLSRRSFFNPIYFLGLPPSTATTRGAIIGSMYDLRSQDLTAWLGYRWSVLKTTGIDISWTLISASLLPSMF